MEERERRREGKERERRGGERGRERTREARRCMLHACPRADSPDLLPGVRCRVDGGDVDREVPHALVGGSQRAVACGAAAAPLASQNGAPVLLEAMVELHYLLEEGERGWSLHPHELRRLAHLFHDLWCAL